jgi:hypothetical protein
MSQVMSWMSRAGRHGGFCFRLMTTLSREIARPVFRPRAIDGRRRRSRSVRESVPGMNSVKPGRLRHSVDVAISGLWSSSFEPFLFHLEPDGNRQPSLARVTCTPFSLHPAFVIRVHPLRRKLAFNYFRWPRK